MHISIESKVRLQDVLIMNFVIYFLFLLLYVIENWKLKDKT